MMISYSVMRRVPATKENGQDCLIAVALVIHENGTRQRVAIDEEFIRFAGENVIEHEVRKAAELPAIASIVRQHT
jgi:2-C-methyl-D-erythritol 4-phosphate cytidylyltransferase